MSDFVNFENTRHRPGGIYTKVIDQIKKDGVCPFCPENIQKYHPNPIVNEGSYWLLTNNAYPYEGAKYHLLIIHKRHIESLGEVTPEAWDELKFMIETFVAEHKIPGGSLMMRFGKTSYTGASVSHLHVNFVSPDGEDKERKPIIARIG